MDKAWDVTAKSGPVNGIVAFTVRSPVGELYTASYEDGSGPEIHNERGKVPSIIEQTIVERSVIRYLLDQVMSAK